VGPPDDRPRPPRAHPTWGASVSFTVAPVISLIALAVDFTIVPATSAMAGSSVTLCAATTIDAFDLPVRSTVAPSIVIFTPSIAIVPSASRRCSPRRR
jgi:hypothetical protein